ncbi:PilW family protein [Methylohalobius crimeensis]|uniref:PilW family protein n=1 Tax=Methylohalobius crimeensis TaxID=244365 RepID=UPI0003B77765|nr:PilW family protein [Methylohalobius crimeensis]
MTRSKQSGISLVEIMVSLVSGLILTAGVIQIYVANKQTYRVNDASARIQENVRFAMELLARDLRMAGYDGCAGSARILVNTLNDTSSFLYNYGNAIYGFEATSDSAWTPTVDASITSPLGGRDIVTIRGTFESGVPITGQPSNSNDCNNSSSYTADLKIADTSGLDDGDIVIAGDCSKASIFQITNININDNVVHNTGAGTPGNATKNLGACYAGKGSLTKITTRTFYIRNNAAGVPALYRKDGSADAEELVAGIEDMQILYGVDSNGDESANQFLRANDVTDWNRVTSARISLLLRSSEDNITTDSQSYKYNDSTTTPADRRLRRVFTTTISLRNRLP